MTDVTTSTPAPVSATIPSPTIWLPYSVTATAPPPTKPPESEVTVGPWDIADWSVQDYGPRPDDGPFIVRRLGVSVKAVHRDSGETRRQAVAVLVRLDDDLAENWDGKRDAAVAQSKQILRAWVDDLNRAEREDQPA